MDHLFEGLKLIPSQETAYDKGQTLFFAGDKISHFYYIKSGKVKMIRHLEDGTPVTLYVAGGGQMFAEASLFSDCYHCDGVVEESATLLVYTKNDLLKGLAENGKLSMNLMAHFARQIQKLRSQIELINIKSAPERVLTYIQLNSDPDTSVLTLDRPWKTVASEIGLTYEAVYRALATLQKQGLIERDDLSVKFSVGRKP